MSGGAAGTSLPDPLGFVPPGDDPPRDEKETRKLRKWRKMLERATTHDQWKAALSQPGFRKK